MDQLQIILAAWAGMSGVMVAAVYWLMRRMDNVNAQNDARHAQDIKERDETNESLRSEIGVLRKRVQEVETSNREKDHVLNTARERVDELERSLSAVCVQLEAVNERLNRKEEENNRKAEIITQQELRIAALEKNIETVTTQRDEARLALSLVSQSKPREDAKPSTDDVTAAAAKLHTELQRGGETSPETKDSPQEG